MQDNYNNKEIMDRGWHDMHKLLDQEMPVASNGRRALWYWLLPALLMVSLGIGYAWYNTMYHDKAADAKSQSESPAMAELEHSLEKNALKSTKVNGANQSRVDVEKISKAQNFNEGNENSVEDKSAIIELESVDQLNIEQREKNRENINAQPIIKKEKGARNAERNQNAKKAKVEKTKKVIIAETRMSSQSRELVGIMVPPLQNQASQADQNILPVKADMPSVTLRSDIEAAPVIASLNFSELPSKNNEFDFQHGVLVSKRKSRTNLAATAMMRVNADVGLRGIGAGLEVGYQLTPSLSAFAGLQYEYQKVDNILTVEAARDADLFFPNGVDQNTDFLAIDSVSYINDQNIVIASNNLSNRAVEKLTKSIHYLHLPIGLEMNLTRKLALRAGAKFSTVLSAPSKYNVALNDDPLVLSTQNTRASRSNLFDNGFIQNMDVAATMGVSFYMNSRLSIDASYEHGFLPLFEGQGSRNDFNRYFTLGLRYSFSRL